MVDQKLKIAIVVHGRFYVFDLARELIRQGHDVTVFTNYPKFICEKFGIPRRRVKSFLLHGILTRLANRLQIGFLEPTFHVAFSKWAANNLKDKKWDIIKVFSGVALEIFLENQDKGAAKILVRGSSHIRLQSELLQDEEKRAGIKLERPSQWMMQREEKEYQLADFVLVLSDFCLKSFTYKGFSEGKLMLLGLGADLKKFRPVKKVIEHRQKRLLAHEPLRVLTVGTFSFRKGALDLCEMASLAKDKYSFRFVGPIAAETNRLVKERGGAISFYPKTDEAKLHQHYAWADVFVFPTIEDGYPAVLAQALASGLPTLTTANCSGPEMIQGGRMGWILPIRDPQAFLKCLEWCDSHRDELARMVGVIYEDYTSLDYAEVARKFVSICARLKNRETTHAIE